MTTSVGYSTICATLTNFLHKSENSKFSGYLFLRIADKGLWSLKHSMSTGQALAETCYTGDANGQHEDMHFTGQETVPVYEDMYFTGQKTVPVYVGEMGISLPG